MLKLGKGRRAYLQRSYFRGVGIGKETTRDSAVTGGEGGKPRGMF